MRYNDCPYLGAVGGDPVCEASLSAASPGRTEFETFCTTEEHYRCITLLARTLMAGRRKSPQRGVSTASL